MASVAGRAIHRMAVIDDDPDVRLSYSEFLEDLGLEPVEIKGPLEPVRSLFERQLRSCDAAMTDLVLRGSGYAPYNGGDIAVEGSARRFPVLLCTAYSNVNIKLTRAQRRHAPAIIPRAGCDEKLLRLGLERCIAEMDGVFSPDRRPWRTQIEVADIDDDNYVWVIVMGRSPDERIAIFMTELPPHIQSSLKKGRILHAEVNVGACTPEELYFDEWEVA